MYLRTSLYQFLRTTKELVRIHKSVIFGLLETKVNDVKVDSICRQLGFDFSVRVEAIDFSGGIWVLWKDCMNVDILKYTPCIYMKVRSKNERE